MHLGETNEFHLLKIKQFLSTSSDLKELPGTMSFSVSRVDDERSVPGHLVQVLSLLKVTIYGNRF